MGFIQLNALFAFATHGGDYDRLGEESHEGCLQSAGFKRFVCLGS